MTQEMKLLRAAMGGDTAAFEQIVVQYQSLVCAITFSGTGRVDVSEELAQETFISAWKNLRQLTDTSGFRSWLCTIARNRVHSYYRKKKTVPLDPANMAELSDETPTPSDHLIRQEEHVMLEQALMQIPAEYREPLVMYYRQEKSTREVAVGMGLNESTVRTRLHRARQMLREEIAARLERTLEQSAPGKAFTKAVMVAVGGAAIGMSGSAEAASATANAAGTGGSTGIAAVMSTVTAKIITAAAVVAVAVGAVFAYKHLSKVDQPSIPSDETAVAMIEQEPVATPESTEIALPEAEEVAAEPIETPEVKAASMTGEADTKNTADIEPAVISQVTEIPESAEYVFEPNGVLSGRITDAKTGEPVTDARVEISMGRIYTAKTDKNGFYSFKEKIQEQGSFRVGVHSTEYVGITDYDKMPMIFLKKDSQEVKHFKLDKACMLDVWVVDEQGNPLKDADVHATWLADNRRQEINDSMYARRTDENGYILLGGFAPSTSPYLITVIYNREKTISEKDGIRRVESTPNYAYAGKQVVLKNPETIPSVEIVLKKGDPVKGYAEYLDGVPAGGLGICANPDWWHSNYCPKAWPIEPNGFFTIDQILPGTYNLQINIPTGEGSSVGKSLFSTHLPLPDGALLKITVPEKSPESLVSICGSVKFSGEKKPNSVWINAYSKEHGHHSTDLDRDMRGNLETTFCIDRLEPGTYRLQFEGTDIEPVTMENVQAPCDDIEVELDVVGKPRLIGTVVDAETSEPVTHFKVRVKKLKTLRGPNYVQQNQWTDFRNEDGSFEIEAVGPGVYQVQAIAEGYAAQWSEEINTDTHAAALFKLNKGGVITGTVVDSEKHPIQNAVVIPLSLAGGTNIRTKDVFVSEDGSTKTDDKGHFTLSCLAEGNETLKVIHLDYADEIVQDIPVQLNQTTEIKPIMLGKGAAIEGYVYDAFGKPEPSVTIYVQDDSGYGGTNDELAGRLGVAITDPNGFYHVGNLSEKMCYMKRQNEWTSLGVIRRTVMPQNGKASRIDFGGKGKLTGQVIIEGKPLANTRIQLAPAGQPHFGCFKAFAVTDMKGSFCFYPGIAGQYTLYYETTPSRDWSELTVVTISPETDMDAGIIPKQASTLRVYVNQPTEAPEWKIHSMFVQRGDNQSASNVATAVAPETPGEPYIVSSLLPGMYTIKLYRSDMLIYQMPVEIKADEPESEVIIDLPVSNSQLHVISSADTRYLTLFSEDETLQMTLRPDGDGALNAENLPAGRYHLVNGMLLNKQSPLLSFDLVGAETKTIDGSQMKVEPVSMSVLQVEIIDENGTPLTGINVWLEGINGKVEPFVQYGFQTAFTTSPGKYTLHTAQPGYKDVNKPISLEAIDVKELNNQKPQKMLLRLEKE